jgi:hypothetical protein
VDSRRPVLASFVAVGWYLGLAWGSPSGWPASAVVAAILRQPPSSISVDDRRTRVGRAQIELGYLTEQSG